ncbi:MAG: SatD family protein [Bacillota bacterium]
MEKNRAFVITADIIQSKQINDLQKGIDAKLEKINTEHKEDLYTAFSNLRGDELQAIISKDKFTTIFPVLRSLKRHMGDYSLRIGIGFGEITILNKVNKENYGSWGFNGDAFHKARAALDTLEVKKRTTIHPTTQFNLFEEKIKNNILNVTYYQVDKILSEWDDEMWTIVEYLEQGYTHEEITASINHKKNSNRTRSNYTIKINRSDWYWIQAVEKHFTELIKETVV